MHQIQTCLEDVFRLIIMSIEQGKHNNALSVAKSTLTQLEGVRLTEAKQQDEAVKRGG